MKIFTLSELAREARVSRAKVRQWIGEGLCALQVNVGRRKSWRISEKSFQDFMEREKQQQQQRAPLRPAGGLYPE
jgi:predicted site-specific integrase-resolvase